MVGFLSTTIPYCDFVQCLNPLSQQFAVHPGQLNLLHPDSLKGRAGKSEGSTQSCHLMLLPTAVYERQGTRSRRPRDLILLGHFLKEEGFLF